MDPSPSLPATPQLAQAQQLRPRVCSVGHLWQGDQGSQLSSRSWALGACLWHPAQGPLTLALLQHLTARLSGGLAV